jgi:hypothetical protein
MQKIQIRLTVATTISMILFNLSHSCCAQEIDDEPDRPRNKNTNIYAESNCPECQELSAKGCVPKKNGTPCSIGYCCRGECVETNGIPGIPCVPPIEPYTRNEKPELVKSKFKIYTSPEKILYIKSDKSWSTYVYGVYFKISIFADIYNEKAFYAEIYNPNGTCPCEQPCKVTMGKISETFSIPEEFFSVVIDTIPYSKPFSILFVLQDALRSEEKVFDGREILNLEKPRPCHLWRYIVFSEKQKRRFIHTNFSYEFEIINHSHSYPPVSSLNKRQKKAVISEKDFLKNLKGDLSIPDQITPWSNPVTIDFFVGKSFCESPVCF